MSKYYVYSDKDVDEARKTHDIVLVDFYSQGCKPCRKLSPILDEMAKDYPEVKFIKIDVNAEEGIHTKYNIRYVPTVIIYEHGEEVIRLIGLQERKTYENHLNKLIKQDDGIMMKFEEKWEER